MLPRSIVVDTTGTTPEHSPRTGYTETPEHAPAHSAITTDDRGEHAPRTGYTEWAQRRSMLRRTVPELLVTEGSMLPFMKSQQITGHKKTGVENYLQPVFAYI